MEKHDVQEQFALRRTLSARDLVVYGLLFIGPLAPVGVFGVLDAKSGGAVALVYVIATVAMAFTAVSYAQMSRVVPEAGSVFAYASAGLGRGAGFLAGWLVMLDYLLIPSVAYLFSGIALHALFPAVPAWAFTALAFVVTTALNVSGVRLAARVGLVVLLAEIVVLAVFVVMAVAVLIATGPARPWLSPFTGVGGITTAAVIGAVSVAVLSFLGFDAIASFAEETTGDSRQVGRAVLLCLGAAGALFVLQTYLAGVLDPVPPADLAAHPAAQGTAFYDVTNASVSPWLATLMKIAKAVGPAFAAMAAVAAAGRLLYGMARGGGLPRPLSSVDPRSGTPRAALLSAGVVTLVVSVWAASRDDGLDVLVSVVDIGALAAFTMLHASVIGYFRIRKGSRDLLRHLLVPVAGALVAIWIIVLAGSPAKLVGLLWLAAGVIVLAVRRRGGAGRARSTGS
ncbi:APC family permease [Streptosporangium sp. CA-135522]|uniref:APC family permease n=1 Tax=Streptosporangium sp. CA-135522 TaxID=3240072 RepID=UPI003D8D9AE5